MVGNRKDNIMSECYDIGLDAEKRCTDLLISKGYKVELATKEENIYDHYDIIASKNGSILKIDVKARKKINRSDDKPQDNKIWIELINVNGDPGWLFGKATHFAFEIIDKFILINQKDLLEIVFDDLIKPSKVKTRYGRKDKISTVSSLDIVKKGDII